MNSLAEQIIIDILQEEMDLPDSSIWLRDQNRKIPIDSGLYVIVGMIDSKVMSVKSEINESASITGPSEAFFSNDAQTESYFTDDAFSDPFFSSGGSSGMEPVFYFTDDAQANPLFSDDALTQQYTSGEENLFQTLETTSVQTRENIMISILSRDNQALIRRWEIVAALQSIFAQQQQESNYFKIFRIPSMFVNASEAEGGSNINRFSITVSAFIWYKKDKVLTDFNGDYYDDFNTRVDDETTIGLTDPLFSFRITGDTINGDPSNQ